jgi:hypothetical protein
VIPENRSTERAEYRNWDPKREKREGTYMFFHFSTRLVLPRAEVYAKMRRRWTQLKNKEGLQRLNRRDKWPVRLIPDAQACWRRATS